MARQRNFLKEVFNLFNELSFVKILFLAYASFFRTSVVSINTTISFSILGGNRTTTRGTFHEAKKSEVMFSVWSHFAALRHNFLTFIKKFL
ncbi:MAG TPA: hypothetical protein VJC13_00640 [Candidatus Paceibacterota bacterium]